jgi:hypothetical protein
VTVATRFQRKQRQRQRQAAWGTEEVKPVACAIREITSIVLAL